MTICSIEGCERAVESRGWCGRHYSRWQRHGDPLHPVQERNVVKGSLEDRLRGKTKVTASGCWEWERPQPHGYGQLRWGGRNQLAHRLAYELWVGPIPEGYQVDHLCRNRPCINPDHLEAVTPAENNRRVTVLKTHCKYGHPLSGDNLKIRKGNHRWCRECIRRRKRQQYRNKQLRKKNPAGHAGVCRDADGPFPTMDRDEAMRRHPSGGAA